MTRLGAAILAVAAILPGSAAAWNSRCYLPDGTRCPDGYAQARNRWRGVQTEHLAIWDYSLARSGLPASLNEELTLIHYSDDAQLSAGALEYETWRPVRSDAKARRQRTLTPGEMAMAPDLTWSLWDWATGNETCPPESSWTPVACHEYATHMGPLNSSHFLPQARDFYRHYHELALERAEECRNLYDEIPPDDRERLIRFVEACEKEAMVLEAIGHHYLQDAWAVGHMFARWGGPELSDWAGNQAVAFVMAGFSGLTHGAKEIVDSKLAEWRARIPQLPDRADDPMCAPAPSAEPWVQYIDAIDGVSYYDGIGDIFWELLEPTVTSYSNQRDAMIGCAIQSMREVYAQTAQAHGEMNDALADEADLSRDPSSASCWDQRATNLALGVGFGLHVGQYPGQRRLIPGGGAGGVIMATVMKSLASTAGAPVLTDAEAAQFRRDAGRAGTLIAASAQTQGFNTDLARGGLGSILGIETNDDAAFRHGTPGDTASPPASYVDPPLPWTLDAGKRTEALDLVFADAHAADRCEELHTFELEALRDEASQAISVGDPSAGAKCGLCAQMAEPHLRIGRDELDYDIDREPLCALTSVNADLEYTGTWAVPPTTPGAARQWCGCGRLLVLSRDAFSGGVAFFSTTGGVVDPLPAGSGPSGSMLHTEGGARDVALGGPDGIRAFVPTDAGWLQVFDLLEGAEVELDADDDPATTTAGAPAGVSRLWLGAEPRGVEVLATEPVALAATDDDLVAIDTDTLEERVRIDRATLGLSDNERPFDVAVLPDDSKAYVTIYGPPPGAPSDRVLVLDLGDVIGGTVGPFTVLASIDTGADTNNQAIAVSHDGSKVAVACLLTDRIAIIDTATDDLWDIDPESPTWNGQFYVPDFFLPSEAPSAVAWADDDSAVYAGYLTGPQGSSIEGNGTVRKCVIGEDACWHAVAVQAPVRAIAVVGSGSARIVYVADSSGWITPIRDALFEPGLETSATDNQGLFDGTGGCVENFGGYLRARPCDSAACMLDTGNLGDPAACEAAAKAGSFGLQASALVGY
ncbi:MAG: YncE family protein [Deltaproteobacteria bacterium]|nr:YncE family protein [Deltaproteobacteria bacterium]